MIKELDTIIYVSLTIVVISLTLLFGMNLSDCNVPGIPEPPEIIYVPQKIIVDHYIQSETTTIPIEDFKGMLQGTLGSSLEEIQLHLESLDMSVIALNETEVTGTGTTIIERVIEGDCQINEVSEQLTQSFYDSNEELQAAIPMGEVSLDSEGLLEASLYDLRISSLTLITETDEHSISAITSIRIQPEGYELIQLPHESITHYRLRPPTTTPQPSHYSFNLWDPSIDLNLEYMNGPGGGIGFSLSMLERYGEELIRFIRPGIGYSDAYEVYYTFSPVQYNIGANLPIFDNLWIAPGIGLDSELNRSFSIGLGATL